MRSKDQREIDTARPRPMNIFVNTYETPNNNQDDDHNGRIDDYRGWNSYDQTGNVQDDNGHGTQLAGVIGAVANNNAGRKSTK